MLHVVDQPLRSNVDLGAAGTVLEAGAGKILFPIRPKDRLNSLNPTVDRTVPSSSVVELEQSLEVGAGTILLPLHTPVDRPGFSTSVADLQNTEMEQSLETHRHGLEMYLFSSNKNAHILTKSGVKGWVKTILYCDEAISLLNNITLKSSNLFKTEIKISLCDAKIQQLFLLFVTVFFHATSVANLDLEPYLVGSLVH